MRVDIGPRVGVVVGLAMILAGCGGTTAGSGSGAGPGGSNQLAGTFTPATVNFLPADKAQGVSPDTAVTIKSDNGSLQGVSVHVVGDMSLLPGTLAANKRSWTASMGLVPGAQYQAQATAVSSDGNPTTATAAFSTLNGDRLTTSANPGDGETVGVGMPIKLKFNTPIPQAQEAAMVAHIQVVSTPQQSGDWHWFSPTEVHYRPQVFWQAHTTVTVNANLQGINAGNNTWGFGNWSEAFTVGDKHVSLIDHNTETMNVYTNDQLVKTIPVSLGKAGFPTISGTLVVWYKSQKVMMDSCASGIECRVGAPNYYKEDVFWNTAISTDGFFIHDAYWDLFAQGHYDFSHGCVNIAPANAIWFFGYAQVGDVVQISNTARQADAGDGEGDWQIPFDQYPNSTGAAPEATRQPNSGGV